MSVCVYHGPLSGANLCTKHSATMSTLRTDSCHSSYDNLDITTSDYEDLGMEVFYCYDF